MSKLLSLFTFYDSDLASKLFSDVPLSSHDHVMYVSGLWIVVCSDFVRARGLWSVLIISVACGWWFFFLVHVLRCF